MRLPLTQDGQTIKDADGVVIVSDMSPCSDADRKTIVEYVNGFAGKNVADDRKHEQDSWASRFEIGDPEEECAPLNIDPRTIHTCLRCGKEFDKYDHFNPKVYDRKLDGTWGISHFGCWSKAEFENQVLHRKRKDV